MEEPSSRPKLNAEANADGLNASRTKRRRETISCSRAIILSQMCTWRFLGLSLWCAIFSTSAVAQQPQHRWTLSPGHVQQNHLSPVAGNLPLSLPDSASFSSEEPAALQFSGREDEVLIVTDDPAAAELPVQQFTVEAWVQLDAAGEWGGLCGILQDNGDFERGWLLGYREDRFCFAVSSQQAQRLTYLTAPASFQTGFWYHVVGTYDGQHMRLFVDGDQLAESTEQQGDVLMPPSAKLAIGGYLDDNENYPLQGRLQQVAIYRQALSETQVRQLFARRRHLFPGIEAIKPEVTGWPTYQRDYLRSGLSDEQLSFPLQLRWVHQPQHKPAPAWPPPAENDFWNRKYNLKPRVTYDRAFHVVSIDRQRLYFGSSADCQVHCVDLQTGRELWTFFTDGPVRLAPTIADDRLVFGSDDGRVYCLNRFNGELLWTYAAQSGRRQIAGNERIISAQPVRTGVLVEENKVWVCQGLFPEQGVFQVMLDLETGRELARQPMNVAAQGYLERRSGRLFVPTGRDPAGAFASQLARRHKDPLRAASQFSEDYPFAFVGAQGVRIAGGQDRVAAFSVASGQAIWNAAVDGDAYGLAVHAGCLLVSTSSGSIYCFESAAADNRHEEADSVDPQHVIVRPDPPEPVNVAPELVRRVTQIVNQSGTRQGYCLLIDCQEPQLAIALAQQSDLRIVVLQRDAGTLKQNRRAVADAGLYDQVCVQLWNSDVELPFTDYLFNLVLWRPSEAGTVQPTEELKREIVRVMAPGRSTALAGVKDETLHQRPPLSGIGEWSHMYGNAANTSSSTDERVHGRMQLQWFGEPGPRQMLNRHHRTVAPLWKDGRLFIPGNDQVFASDAYNGTLLWTRQIPDSRRIAAFRDCSYMAAGANHLFVAAADHCLSLNPETGYTEHIYQIPDRQDRKLDWGFVAQVGRQLFGSATAKGAARREHTRESIIEAAYFDARKVICSEQLFAFDTDSTAHEWSYRAQHGAILNSTITVADRKVFFIESRNAGTLEDDSGRYLPTELMKGGADLVALDATDGREIWRVDARLNNVQHNTYLSAAQNRLAAVGTRNSGSDRKESRVVYEIRVFDSASGDMVWQTTQTQDTKIDGDHGEQDLHPVIVGDRLYCEPNAYRLENGTPLTDWGWKLGKRRGCGNISASSRSFFFRESSPTMFDLQTQSLSPVTTATRPGCLINILPAGGLLLIPEASSGCTCDYGVQTSLAFLPVPEAADPSEVDPNP